MIDISTSFVGLQLKSPIIVGSSGLTRSLDKVKSFAEAGAGAVILKSLFEEQIEAQIGNLNNYNDYTEGAEYLAHYVKADEVTQYLELIRRYKAELDIPVIASICCMRSSSWLDYAAQVRDAGADAIEINIMKVETDLFYDPIASEQGYILLIKELKSRLNIPIIVKLSRYHSALPAFVDKLRAAGASAVTLFNRTYQTDINLDTEELSSGDVFSHEGDFTETLRFTALVSGAISRGLDISASTGIYSWKEVTKALLAGATTTQMATALYKQGASAISEAIAGLQEWLDEHGYLSVDEMRGRLNAMQTGQSNTYERVQFMRYFGNAK